MNTVYYWADGTWCYDWEYTESGYNWKSDDFGKLSVSDEESDEGIQILIHQLIS